MRDARSMLSAALSALKRLANARSASAAVEFAIILPVALVLYFGAAEVADAVMTSRKVNTITRTVLDLLSRQPTSFQKTSIPAPPNAITAATLSSIFTAATSLISPEPATPLTMTLSAVDITNDQHNVCCKVKVRWSYTQNGTLRPCKGQLTGASPSAPPSPTTISDSLLPSGTQLPSPIAILITDIGYTYQPVIASPYLRVMPTMARTEYIMPRTTGQVVATALPSTGSQTGMVCY